MNKEIEIPEGYEARIEGNKVILEPKESEDEKIRKEIRDFVCWAVDRGSITAEQLKKSNSWLSYLERQKKPTKWRKYFWRPEMRFAYGALVKYDGLYGFEIVSAGNKPSKEVNGLYVFLKDI